MGTASPLRTTIPIAVPTTTHVYVRHSHVIGSMYHQLSDDVTWHEDTDLKHFIQQLEKSF